MKSYLVILGNLQSSIVLVEHKHNKFVLEIVYVFLGFYCVLGFDVEIEEELAAVDFRYLFFKELEHGGLRDLE